MCLFLLFHLQPRRVNFYPRSLVRFILRISTNSLSFRFFKFLIILSFWKFFTYIFHIFFLNYWVAYIKQRKNERYFELFRKIIFNRLIKISIELFRNYSIKDTHKCTFYVHLYYQDSSFYIFFFHIHKIIFIKI